MESSFDKGSRFYSRAFFTTCLILLIWFIPVADATVSMALYFALVLSISFTAFAWVAWDEALNKDTES